jgi:DNA-binding SARP family transcriptional activator
MTQMPIAVAPSDDSLRLLSGFLLTRAGHEVVMTSGCQRLVALLAVNGPSGRTVTAGTLWPDVPDLRASGNLRTCLWRLNHLWPGLVHSDERSLSLSQGLRLDVDELTTMARTAADPCVQLESGGHYRGIIDAGELLPGWYDDWVVLARERLRLLRLNALELLSSRLLGGGQIVWAMESALASARAEPLRESAHNAVLSVHVACGNVSEARRYYRYVRHLLRTELGVEPGESLRRLAAQVERRAGVDAGRARASAEVMIALGTC